MKENTLRIGNFNILNLALPNVPFYGRNQYSEEVYQKKINWIAQQLDTMKAHVVGFQEVFHKEALQTALARSTFLTNAYCVMSERSGESPAVAIASTFPIIDQEFIHEFPVPLDIDGVEMPIRHFSRPVLRADIQIRPNLVITFFIAHLKSKRPVYADNVNRNDPVEKAKGEARSLIRRAVEAVALREIMMKYLKDRDHPVVVMGDLNDADLAVTTQLVSGEPPHRKLPHDAKKEIWDVLLYHAKAIQARKSYHDFYYSHIHNGHHEALDHIMVSQELVGENPAHVGRVTYVSVLNDHLIDETLSNETVPLWQSDHAQIVASIELKS